MDREEKIEVDKLVAETNWKHIQILELKDKIKEQEERIHTLEVYLEGAVNYLILDGDVDNNIIDCVESILHITFNRSPNVPTVYQKLAESEKIILEQQKKINELQEQLKDVVEESYSDKQKILELNYKLTEVAK
jgi:hypothetical protein